MSAVKFQRGLGADYHALEEKDNNTFYYTTDEAKLYVGDKDLITTKYIKTLESNDNDEQYITFTSDEYTAIIDSISNGKSVVVDIKTLPDDKVLWTVTFDSISLGSVYSSMFALTDDSNELWYFKLDINDSDEVFYAYCYKNTGIAGIVSITYEELVGLRDDNQLIPGQQYRITDYVTTVNGTYDISEQYGDTAYIHYAKSAEHPFDLIVTAVNENTLDEHAVATLHSGDTYFANNNLEAWDIKYTLDNDPTKYTWADSTNGKGVIYYLKDEFNNSAGYDFKNVQILAYALSGTGYLSYTESDKRYGSVGLLFYLLQESDLPYENYEFESNDILDCITYPEVTAEYLSTFNADWYYTFDCLDDNDNHIDASLCGNGQKVQNNTIESSYDNLALFDDFSPYRAKFNRDSDKSFDKIPDELKNLDDNTNPKLARKITREFKKAQKSSSESNDATKSLDEDSSLPYGINCSIWEDGKMSTGIQDNFLASQASFNIFGYGCWNNKFGTFSYCNIFGNGSISNILNSQCYFNILEDHCEYNIFGGYCEENTLGYSCTSNTFGDYFCYNTLDEYCDSNIFGNYCYSNILENHCYNNVFGGSSDDNTLGSSCQYNSFGQYCFSNTFGKSCANNKFGNSCSHNTFEDHCESNILGDKSSYNTVVQYCVSNTLGYNCTYNTLGDSSTVSFALRICFCKLEDNISYIKLLPTVPPLETGTFYGINYHILSSVKGTKNDIISIYIPHVYSLTNNIKPETYVGYNSSGVLKTWIPADLVYENYDGSLTVDN